MSLKGEQWKIFSCISFSDGSHNQADLLSVGISFVCGNRYEKKEGSDKLHVC